MARWLEFCQVQVAKLCLGARWQMSKVRDSKSVSRVPEGKTVSKVHFAKLCQGVGWTQNCLRYAEWQNCVKGAEWQSYKKGVRRKNCYKGAFKTSIVFFKTLKILNKRMQHLCLPAQNSPRYKILPIMKHTKSSWYKILPQ